MKKTSKVKRGKQLEAISRKLLMVKNYIYFNHYDLENQKDIIELLNSLEEKADKLNNILQNYGE